MVPRSVQGCWEIKLKENSVVPSGFRCQEIVGVFSQSSVCGEMGAGIELHRKRENGDEHIALFQEFGCKGRRMRAAGK